MKYCNMFFLFMLETQNVGTPHLRVTTLYVYIYSTSRSGTYLRNVVFRRGFVSIWSLARLQYDNSSNHE